MKKLFAALTLFVASHSIVFSQVLENESKVIEFLGSERYQTELASNPGLIYFLDAKASYGFEIIDIIPGKEGDFQSIDDIQLHSKSQSGQVSATDFLNDAQSADFNFLMYNFTMLASKNQYFKLGDTGKAIIIYSVEHVNSKIAQH